MLRRLILLFACLCVAGGTALANPTPKPAHKPVPHPASAALHKSKVAPADSYFGRLKMSVLGIQNVIKDMRLRIEADPDKTPSIFGSLAMVEDAIHDWERQYPQDSWIAKDLLALEVTYLEASGDRARSFAVRTEAWLRRDYARSAYAAQGHKELVEATVAAAPSPAATAAPASVPTPADPH